MSPQRSGDLPALSRKELRGHWRAQSAPILAVFMSNVTSNKQRVMGSSMKGPGQVTHSGSCEVELSKSTVTCRTIRLWFRKPLETFGDEEIRPDRRDHRRRNHHPNRTSKIESLIVGTD